MSIKRYAYTSSGMGESSVGGYWVRYEDHVAVTDGLMTDNQELAHALRLAIAGRPVRNADELLARATLEDV